MTNAYQSLQNKAKMETFWLVGRHDDSKKRKEKMEQENVTKSTGGRKKKGNPSVIKKILCK